MNEHQCYLSIGSNIDRELHISAGLSLLAKAFPLNSISSVYESEAVGFSGDPFYNLVVNVSTSLRLRQLAAKLRNIEAQQGRIRNAEKFTGRTLDIDILLYDDFCGIHDNIELPRPELFANAYVLQPLAEIAPHMDIPGTSSTAIALWQAYDKRLQKLWVIPFMWNGKPLPNTATRRI